MSDTTPSPYPIQHRTTRPGTHFAYTIVPILFYLLAEHIPLPTIVIPTRFAIVEHSYELYNIATVGIIPWIIAAIIVEIAALSIRDWRHLRYEGAIGRAKLQNAANILGLVIAVFHSGLIAVTLIFIGVVFDPDHPDHDFGLFGPRPYATSPILAFASLLAGAVFARLLAEVVSRRGLAHGYGVVFGASLLVSTLRTISRISDVPEWTDVLRLATNVFFFSVALIWLIITKLQAARQAPASPVP